MSEALAARSPRRGPLHDASSAPPDVHGLLKERLLSGALTPGAPLRELALARDFGVSRERVRKALHRLGTERLVELVPNRGAFVPRPDPASTREAYDARRALECGVVLMLADTLSPPQAARLEAHLAAERSAAARGDRAAAVRLSGQFHRLLAEMGGNALVARFMDELVSRTSIVVALHEQPSPSCGLHEHEDIVAALHAGDGPRAARAMASHLALIETRIRLPGVQDVAAKTASKSTGSSLGRRRSSARST